MHMDKNERREANQAKLDRLMQEAQWRIPVGKTNSRGGVWNGTVWVYGRR